MSPENKRQLRERYHRMQTDPAYRAANPSGIKRGAIRRLVEVSEEIGLYEATDGLTLAQVRDLMDRVSAAPSATGKPLL